MKNEAQLLNRLEQNEYKKSSLQIIAKEYNISKTELERFYIKNFFQEIAQEVNLQSISSVNIEFIQNSVPKSKEKKFKFIKNHLKKIIEKSLYIAMTNGFKVNINEINSGVMTANAGDSAEFIFVARAILAGFNCSSVDVRSSRYDAIIDFNNKLLRVQIKGISTGNNISFKDRDRGGQGIDHTHQRNIGKRITSQDCDIYVAVDKQVGLCYVIPMSWADSLEEDEIKTISLNKIEQYKENWQVIKDLCI